MLTFTLKGRSNLGKNRVREHGSQWEVLEQTSPIKPHSRLMRSVKTDHLRWMDLTQDPHLEIVTAE